MISDGSLGLFFDQGPETLFDRAAVRVRFLQNKEQQHGIRDFDTKRDHRIPIIQLRRLDV